MALTRLWNTYTAPRSWIALWTSLSMRHTLIRIGIPLQWFIKWVHIVRAQDFAPSNMNASNRFLEPMLRDHLKTVLLQLDYKVAFRRLKLEMEGFIFYLYKVSFSSNSETKCEEKMTQILPSIFINHLRLHFCDKSLNLHREIVKSDQSPFDKETWRPLWWHIRVFSFTASLHPDYHDLTEHFFDFNILFSGNTNNSEFKSALCHSRAQTSWTCHITSFVMMYDPNFLKSSQVFFGIASSTPASTEQFLQHLALRTLRDICYALESHPIHLLRQLQSAVTMISFSVQKRLSI